MMVRSKQAIARSLVRVAASLCVLSSVTVAQSALGAMAQEAVSPSLETRIHDVRLFEEPLIATGPSDMVEQQALWDALQAYRAGGNAEDVAPLQAFLDAHPNSAWNLALHTNLGLTYYRLGYFSRAIDAWETAWRESSTATQPDTKRLADRALGELLRMHARLGHADRVAALLKESQGRVLQGPATEAEIGAREGLWMMRHDPGVAYLCGPMALKNILEAEGADPKRIAQMDAVRSSPHGVSLATVGELAQQVKLPYTIAKRAPGTPIPLPAVVHWKVNHYAAIVGEAGGRYHLKDPTFGNDLWISKAALESETSNYFVIPKVAAKLPGWSQVAQADANKIVGMGFTNGNDPGRTGPGDPPATTPSGCNGKGGSGGGNGSGNGTPPGGNPNSPGGCNGSGMPRYSVTAMLVSLNLIDTPLSYVPPKGPSIKLTLRYNQRDAYQPANFSYFNFGPKWTSDWLAFIQDDPSNPGNSVMRYQAGGGATFPSGYNGSTFAPDPQDQSILVRVSANSYERDLKDGSKEIYAQADGATFYPRRVFLSQIVDAQGNAITLNYDSQLRLTNITDATGKSTALSYGNANNNLLVTQITDPFGRTASIGYDSSGRVSSLTDAMGMTSTFGYDSGTFINTLTTPYGTTTFAYGESGTERWINITNPQGQTERVEYVQGVSSIPFVESQAPSGMNLFNEYINYRDTYYWNNAVYAQAPGDYTKARITHWLHEANNTNMTAGVIESTKEPLENRVWYNYPGQPWGGATGSSEEPTLVGRVLDDGSTQLYRYGYNAQGNVTSKTDPTGRQTQYQYAANGIDVLQVSQVNGASSDLLAQYTYNAQHEPLTYRDAAGQLTTYTYNAAGQKTSETNALGQTTQWVYDSNGFLTSEIDANGKTAAAYTYDAVGRVASRTDSEGWTANYQYDALNRLTHIQYPDSTTRQLVWNKLDVASVTDRLGRTTNYTYDNLGRLIKVTDPLSRTVQLGYYANGPLQSLTDAAGHVTTWQRDLQSRVTGKTYVDGSSDSFTYEATTSRLKGITDALGQAKTLSYTEDNRVAGVDYSGAINSTPNVSVSYDSVYPRVDVLTDGTGSHNYSYAPVGTLGANQLATETIPGQTDTLSYQYDALGRRIQRNLGSLSETWSYDTLGRPVSHGTPLGQFDSVYLGETGQVSNRSLEGSAIQAIYKYDTNVNDRRLIAINNSAANGRSPTSFSYTIDPENRILTMLESNGGAMKPHNYRYDAVDRVLADIGNGASGWNFGYDVADNRMSATGPGGPQTIVANALNQMQSINGQAVQYDAAGELLQDNVRQYSWDAEHRLVGIRYLAQPGKQTQFAYDGLSRRTQVTEIDPSNSATQTEYVWCGQVVCQKRDGTGQVLRSYYAEGEYGPEIGKRVAPVDANDVDLTPSDPTTTVPVQQINGSGALVYEGNHLGSVSDTLALDGKVMTHTDYSPYGNTQSMGRGDFRSDFRYAWMLYHPASEMYLTQFRAYDPNTGRWVSRDPIGEKSGIDLYRYVADNPLSYVDPLGLDTQVTLGLGGTLAAFIGVGGSASFGINIPDNLSNLGGYQIFGQFQGNIMGGGGIFGGAGGQLSISHTCGPLSPGLSTSGGWYGEADLGWGGSVGASVQGPGQLGPSMGVPNGGSYGGGTVGGGAGVYIGVGATGNVTIASPTIGAILGL